MVSGHLRIQNGIYQCIISYNDYNGKRKTKSISTGLVAKGNKKRAEEMLSELRRTFVPPKPERGENEFREDMLFSDFIPVAVGYRKDGKTHDLQLLLEYGDEEDFAVF